MSATSTNTQRSSNSPSSIDKPDVVDQTCVLELSCQKVTTQSVSRVDIISGMKISGLVPVLSNLTLNFTLFCEEVPP